MPSAITAHGAAITALLHLAGSIATVNAKISTSSVAGSVTGEVDVCAFQLCCLSITTHWDHAMPEILSLLVNEVRQTSVDVAR